MADDPVRLVKNKHNSFLDLFRVISPLRFVVCIPKRWTEDFVSCCKERG